MAAKKKPAPKRVYVGFPPDYDDMTEAEQLAVCERMAEEMQRVLLPQPEKRRRPVRPGG